MFRYDTANAKFISYLRQYVRRVGQSVGIVVYTQKKGQNCRRLVVYVSWRAKGRHVMAPMLSWETEKITKTHNIYVTTGQVITRRHVRA